MKIVHLVLNGPFSDGFTYQENIMPKYHKKQGYDVTILASNWIWNKDGNLEPIKPGEYVTIDGVKVIRIAPKFGNSNSRFKRYPSLFKEIERESPDILFIHDCQFLDIFQVAKYLKKNKCKKVFLDNHSDFSNSARNWLSLNILHKIIWRKCAQIINPYVDKFYGVLPARVDFLVDVYKLPKEKCELLVMGADDEYVEKASSVVSIRQYREKLSAKETDFLIVTGGKIDLAKPQTLELMKAVNRINNSSVKLAIFGSVHSELKKQFDSLLSDRVRYYGWISGEESYFYFAASDLVVFPGRHSVFWEQVAGQGIPMIVKYWEGTHHVDLGGNVVFLHNDTATEIQTEIEKLLVNNGEYQNMKNIAESEGMKYFSYQEIAKRSIEDFGL